MVAIRVGQYSFSFKYVKISRKKYCGTNPEFKSCDQVKFPPQETRQEDAKCPLQADHGQVFVFVFVFVLIFVLVFVFGLLP